MAIDWGRVAKGVTTGYLSAKIANTAANDELNADIIRAAGLEYYTKTLPDFKDTEKNKATAYKQISTYFDSEQAADYFDANGFITGDGQDLERIQTLLENKKIKKDAFKDYIPTTNYADRYSTSYSICFFWSNYWSNLCFGCSNCFSCSPICIHRFSY